MGAAGRRAMAPGLSKAQQELQEEHLGEAAFLWTAWESALLSPVYTLEELAEGPEERLLAHLDALVLGDSAVREKLLRPGLGLDEEDVVTASALALLSSRNEEAEEAVLEAFEQAPPDARGWLRRALELSASPRCLKALSRRLSSPEACVQAAALEVLTFWGVDPGPLPGELLSHDDPEVVAAALKAARITEERVDERSILGALDSPDAQVRAEALRTALTLEPGPAWPLCRKLASGPFPDGTALLFLGLGGNAADLERLLEASRSPSASADALWALGFSGYREAAERCLELLEDDALGRLAAEAFCAMTGLRLTGPLERAAVKTESFEEEDGSAEPVRPRPEDKLPLASPEAVLRWWREHRGHFERGVRYLLGRPLTGPWLMQALEQVSMRRRHVLAEELALRSRGRLLVQTRGFCARQRAGLQEAQELLGRMSLSRPFQEVLATARPPRRVPSAQQGSAAARPRQGSRPPAGRLAITGLGMISALGDGVAASCAASRAGLSRVSSLEEVQVWDPGSRTTEPARAAVIPWLTEGFSGTGRLAALASEALLDLLARARLEPGPRCALYVAAPSGYYLQQLEEREGVASRHEERRATYTQRLLPALLRAAGLQPPPKVQPLVFGETGFLLALQDARRQLETGAVDACIIGGVDSLAEPRLIEALDQLRLLKTPGNPVGFLPGEASAFVLVERWDAAVRRDAQVLATLDAPCLEAEPFHRLSRKPALGEALARCIRRTLGVRPSPGEQTLQVIAALNGDSYRAADWGHALVALRSDGTLTDAPTWYPAVSFGETGAAAGPVGICLAVRGFERGYLREGSALLWVSGDDGSRGSLLLHSPEPTA